MGDGSIAMAWKGAPMTEAQLIRENRQLREALVEAESDCRKVAKVPGISEGERRAWESVANKIKAALTKVRP